jgi:uncharacterized membrane protein YedE/YeeE
MDIHPWLQSLAGGLLIGLAAALLLLGSGRIAGISGVVGSLVEGHSGPRNWRLWFIAGLLLPAIAWRLSGHHIPGTLTQGTPLAIVAGLLVGFGTRLGNGCTSGHGLCGLGNRSPRSLVAVVIFFGVAAITVFVARHVLPSLGGAAS